MQQQSLFSFFSSPATKAPTLKRKSPTISSTSNLSREQDEKGISDVFCVF